jgi:hypothetical protein
MKWSEGRCDHWDLNGSFSRRKNISCEKSCSECFDNHAASGLPSLSMSDAHRIANWNLIVACSSLTPSKFALGKAVERFKCKLWSRPRDFGFNWDIFLAFHPKVSRELMMFWKRNQKASKDINHRVPSPLRALTRRRNYKHSAKSGVIRLMEEFFTLPRTRRLTRRLH